MSYQIVLSTSNEYAYSCFVTIASLIESASKEKQYKINILVDSEFSVKSQTLLTRVISGNENFDIAFVNMDDRYPNCARKFHTEGYINRNTYFRYYIPDLFPNDSLVLYLDSDLVILDDVAKVFSLDIGNNWLACCKNVSCIFNFTMNNKLKNGVLYREYFQKLGIIDILTYAQTGVALFNNIELRKHDVMQLWIEHTLKLDPVFFDQDIINQVCQNKFYYIDLEWNHVWYYCDVDYLRNGLSPEVFNAYAAARKHPKIVHYAGPKPWIYPERELGEYFWQIAFKDQEIFNSFVQQGFSERKSVDSGLSQHEYISAINQCLKGTHSLSMSLLDAEIKSEVIESELTRLLPAYGDGSINICFSSSEEYAPFVSVVIQSILDNRDPLDQYDIVICTVDMVPRTQHLLMTMANGIDNVSIRFFNIKTFVDNITFYTWAHFTPNTYYRLLIPEVFERYNKVLYLDSDVVVCDDIAKLFRVNIADGYLFAAVRDTHVESYRARGNVEFIDNCRSLGIDEGAPYFQCGVSLFNIQAMRKAFPDNFLIRDASTSKYTWMDQDLLNKQCFGRIQQLSNRWNVMVLNDEVESEKFLPQPLFNEYYEARKSPAIVHYVGRSIPFYRPEIDFAELYWPYARKTLFYEILLKKMQFDVCYYVYSGFNERASKRSFKMTIKSILLAPIGLFAPKGSKLREKIKVVYKRFRTI